MRSCRCARRQLRGSPRRGGPRRAPAPSRRRGTSCHLQGNIDEMATPPSSIEDQVAQLCDEARAAWPEVTVDKAAVVEAFVAKLGGEEPPALTSANVAELYLAVACARGDEKAVRIFDRD